MLRRAQIITVQLAQALSSGQLSGDELRSLTENAGGLALELERAVQEILNTKTPLKELGTQGGLTTAVLLQAFKKAFDGIRDEMEKLPRLWEQQVAELETAWNNFLATVADETKFGVAVQAGLKGAINIAKNTLNNSTLSIKVDTEVETGEGNFEAQTSDTIRTAILERQRNNAREVKNLQREIQTAINNLAAQATKVRLYDNEDVSTLEVYANSVARLQGKLQDVLRTERLLNEILAERSYLTTTYDPEFVKLTQDAYEAGNAFAKMAIGMALGKKALTEFGTASALFEGQESSASLIAKKTAQILGFTPDKPIKIKVDTKEITEQLQRELKNAEAVVKEIADVLADAEDGQAQLSEETKKTLRAEEKLLETKIRSYKKQLEINGIRTNETVDNTSRKKVQDAKDEAAANRKNADELAKANRERETALEQYQSLKAAFNPIIAAQQEYVQKVLSISKALDTQAISQKEAQRTLLDAQREFDENVRTIKAGLFEVEGYWDRLINNVISGNQAMLGGLEAGLQAYKDTLTTPVPGGDTRLSASAVVRNVDADTATRINDIKRNISDLETLLASVKEELAKGGLTSAEEKTFKSGQAALEQKIKGEKELLDLAKQAGYQTYTQEELTQKAIESAKEERRLREDTLRASERQRTEQARGLEDELRKRERLLDQLQREKSLREDQLRSLARTADVRPLTGTESSTKQNLGQQLSDLDARIQTAQQKVGELNQQLGRGDQYRREKQLEGLSDQADRLQADATSAEQQDRNLQGLLRGYERLRGALDPVVAIENQRARDMKLLNDLIAEYNKQNKDTAEILETQKEVAQRTDAEIKKLSESYKLQVSLGTQIRNSFGSWIDSAVDGTFKLRDALSGLLKDLAKLALQAALLNGLKGSAVRAYPWTQKRRWAAFPGGMSLDPGIYTKPTLFKFAKGGVLGEAGPEAVLPLARMPSGDLGVQGGAANVTVNITEGTEGQGEVKQRRGPGGQTILDIVVDRVRGEISSDIMRGRGVISALEQQYGLSRSPGAY